MEHNESINHAFPELADIEDDLLRERVVDAWKLALDRGSVDKIADLSWWPPLECELGQPVQNVKHVRDVTAIASAIADALTDREYIVDQDVVLAGAITHDVSKSVEIENGEMTEYANWIPHPHGAVTLLDQAGLPAHVQHISLAHSERSSVEPQSIEAAIVTAADELAVSALFAHGNRGTEDE